MGDKISPDNLNDDARVLTTAIESLDCITARQVMNEIPPEQWAQLIGKTKEINAQDEKQNVS